jgi:hypothetical protein
MQLPFPLLFTLRYLSIQNQSQHVNVNNQLKAIFPFVCLVGKQDNDRLLCIFMDS